MRHMYVCLMIESLFVSSIKNAIVVLIYIYQYPVLTKQYVHTRKMYLCHVYVRTRNNDLLQILYGINAYASRVSSSKGD